MSALSPLIEEAVELAAEWHDRTYRKSRWRDASYRHPDGGVPGVPTISHLVNVALVVQRAGWDDVTVAAALMHDAVEDANMHGDTLLMEDLTRRLGEDVARRVMVVTETKHDAEGRRRPWIDRKREYIATLERADPEAVAISLADKLHNLWTINRAIERGIDVFSDAPGRRRLVAGPERQAWYVRSVIEASRRSSDPRLEPMRVELLAELARFERLCPAAPGDGKEG